MDSKTNNLAKLNELHPKLRNEAIAAWTECEAVIPSNVKLWIDQAYRTFEQSDELYAQGRTKPGLIVTNAGAGKSYHNYGLAFDFHMITDGKADWNVGPLWMKVVAIMKAHGFTWSGDFKTIVDRPHFEKTYGHNYRELLALHEAKKFIEGTTYVQI